MCRSYGKYVRACYATGRHRGELVPIAQAMWGKSSHLVFGRPASGVKKERSATSRCPRCGRPRSRHDSPGEVCWLCLKEGRV